MHVNFIILALLGFLIGSGMQKRSRREVFWIGSSLVFAGMLTFLLMLREASWFLQLPQAYASYLVLLVPFGLGIAVSSLKRPKN